MKNSILKNIDKPTLIMYLIFIIVGWVCIYEASYQSGQPSIFDVKYRSGLQLIWIGISLVTAVALLFIEVKTYTSLAYIIYGGIILILIATIFVAPNIKGSHSWLTFGVFSIQPAEFAKFATALALAKLFGAHNFKNKSLINKIMLTSILIVLPAAIILLQKETGLALVFFAMTLMLYREGLSPYIILVFSMLIVIFIIMVMFASTPFLGIKEASLGRFVTINLVLIIAIIISGQYMERNSSIKIKHIFAVLFGIYFFASLFHIYIFKINFVYIAWFCTTAFFVYLIYNYVKKWKIKYLFPAIFVVGFVAYSYSVEYVFEDVLQTHQQSRIKVLLGMENDPQGSAWNTNQAKIAIGSGGFWGKGFLKGTQTKLKFVPEQDTDFIFCTIGEELGFVGSFAIMLLFVIFILRLIYMAERQTNVFSRVYGYCVIGIFLFHFVINIGMVLGIMPVIGIPLPFFSYGGSSLLSSTILLFVFLKIDAVRRVNR